MKLITLALVCLLLFAPAAFAQANGAPRIAGIGPSPYAAPGQIVELRVEGLGEQFISPPPGDALRILVTQDGSTKTASARTASPVMVRETTPPGAPGSGGLKPFQGLTFVVPRGLHAGEAEVVVSFRGRKSEPFKLNVVERPQRPLVGGAPIRSIAPATLPAPTHSRTPATRPDLGLKFERGAKGVELHVRPLPDPEDPESGVNVRFKQGGAYYEANARVVHREGGREDLHNGGFRLSPARDVLIVDVPDLLAPGEAELEVTLRAAGQTGDAALVPVTVTDAARAFESPKEAAPRMLAVSPRRVGAGQALMISVDRRRSLDPEPSKAAVVFEAQDGTRHTVKPEMNSAVREPGGSPDLPVLLIVRAPEGLTGAARVRLLNPARADYEGAESEPAEVEIVSEPVAPEVTSVAEASEAELAQLRRLAEAQSRDPRVRPVYESSARYISIRGTGFDPNPQFLRVRLEQEGREAVTLGRGDFSLYSHGGVIVRMPKGFRPGVVRVSVENRGADGFSAPSVRTFELSMRW
jgi:hypothetical protein